MANLKLCFPGKWHVNCAKRKNATKAKLLPTVKLCIANNRLYIIGNWFWTLTVQLILLLLCRYIIVLPTCEYIARTNIHMNMNMCNNFYLRNSNQSWNCTFTAIESEKTVEVYTCDFKFALLRNVFLVFALNIHETGTHTIGIDWKISRRTFQSAIEYCFECVC